MIPTWIDVLQGLRVVPRPGYKAIIASQDPTPMMPVVDQSPPLDKGALRAVKTPAKQALILICQRCERRVGKEGDAGRRLARRLRKLGRKQLGKGAIRAVFTGCMSLCPRDSLAVAIVPGKHASTQAPRMCIADAARPKAAARALLTLLRPGASEG